MDIFIEEIFVKFSSNQEELTYEEWSNWFLSLEGMKEVLELRPNKISLQKSFNSGKGNVAGSNLNAARRDKGYLEKTGSSVSSKYVHK